MFQGYSKESFEFFMAIRFNNNRDFFQENRDWYQRAVREPSIALAQELAEGIEAIDPDLERRPHRVVSRINRDIRFSRDKSPYRDHIWLSFHRVDAEKGKFPSLYCEISDNGGSCGMGFYHGNRPLMDALRRRILAQPTEAARLCKPVLEEFSLFADINSRISIPEAVPAELRALYAAKTFYFEKEISDFELIRSPALAQELRGSFERLAPLYRYIAELYAQLES